MRRRRDRDQLALVTELDDLGHDLLRWVNTGFVPDDDHARLRELAPQVRASGAITFAILGLPFALWSGLRPRIPCTVDVTILDPTVHDPPPRRPRRARAPSR